MADGAQERGQPPNELVPYSRQEEAATIRDLNLKSGSRIAITYRVAATDDSEASEWTTWEGEVNAVVDTREGPRYDVEYTRPDGTYKGRLPVGTEYELARIVKVKRPAPVPVMGEQMKRARSPAREELRKNTARDGQGNASAEHLASAFSGALQQLKTKSVDTRVDGSVRLLLTKTPLTHVAPSLAWTDLLVEFGIHECLLPRKKTPRAKMCLSNNPGCASPTPEER